MAHCHECNGQSADDIESAGAAIDDRVRQYCISAGGRMIEELPLNATIEDVRIALTIASWGRNDPHVEERWVTPWVVSDGYDPNDSDDEDHDG